MKYCKRSFQPMKDLEEVDHSEYERARVAAGCYAVRIDVERVTRVGVVQDLDVAAVEHGPLRQVVRIRHLPLTALGIGTLDDVAHLGSLEGTRTDHGSVRCAARAVVRLAVERVDAAG